MSHEDAFREYFARCNGDEEPLMLEAPDGAVIPDPLEACPLCILLQDDSATTVGLMYAHCCSAQHIALKYELDPILFEESLQEAIKQFAADRDTFLKSIEPLPPSLSEYELGD